MRSLLLPVTLCAFGLAACDRQDGQGTTVSIDAGNGAASINGATGEVKLDTPLSLFLADRSCASLPARAIRVIERGHRIAPVLSRMMTKGRRSLR